jgi:hypothetical protein
MHQSFRTNKRWGVWLALSAIALQLILSFGHIHLENRLSSSNVVRSTAQATPSEKNPAHHHGNEAADFCATCALIQLASSSFLPDAPHLWTPSAHRALSYSEPFHFVFIARQRTAFRSRAPPLA